MSEPISPRSKDPFCRYSGASVDGVFLNSGQVDFRYKSVVEVLEGFGRKKLLLRQKRLDRAVDELGMQYSDGVAVEGTRNPWRLDLFPAILDEKDWNHISQGIVQRALAFNAYATDMYGAQNVLREKVIPHEFALRDPAFLRQISGVEVPDGEYSQFGAFDLINIPDKGWRVLRHHMGTPFGMSHVLQNRRVLSQIFPELYENFDVAPVAGFSTYLLEMLRAQSKLSNPHIVLLAGDQVGQAYFEEAFIARHMGISIARAGDLLVRESRVFLKTIRGLEPIDVIYRRVESGNLDPIAVPNLSAGGVPGLINVLRKGNVAIVNAPGAGVSDNRALLRYSDRLISFYRNEAPILKSIETYHLNDIDQRSHVAEMPDSFNILPVQDHDLLWQRCGGRPVSSSKATLGRLARMYPEYFIAQPKVDSVTLPRFSEGRFNPSGIVIRVFCILGAEPLVLPGGMALQSISMKAPRQLSILVDGLKDIWVPNNVVKGSEPKRQPHESGERFSIGSRVAESLYWAGRYLERAENTARQFNTLERLRWDQMAHSEQRTYWPLLKAVAAATGQTAFAKMNRPPRDTLPLSKSLLLDLNEGASVRACISYARNGLERVRETISPECLEVLEEIVLYLQHESKLRVSRGRLRQLSEKVVTEVARFSGTAERTLSHDDTWQFYRAGIFMERAMGTLSLLKVALPRVVETYREQDEESADLTALLRLLGSLDAYRREFRSRAYIGRVAKLVLQGRSHPSAVVFCLLHLKYSLGTLSITGEREIGRDLKDSINCLIECVDNFSLAKESGQQMHRLDSGDTVSAPVSTRPLKVEKELVEIVAHMESLHAQIEDSFFSHQDVFARDPVLFELTESR